MLSCEYQPLHLVCRECRFASDPTLALILIVKIFTFFVTLYSLLHVEHRIYFFPMFKIKTDTNTLQQTSKSKLHKWMREGTIWPQFSRLQGNLGQRVCGAGASRTEGRGRCKSQLMNMWRVLFSYSVTLLQAHLLLRTVKRRQDARHSSWMQMHTCGRKKETQPETGFCTQTFYLVE